jgi:hypothetical protein
MAKSYAFSGGPTRIAGGLGELVLHAPSTMSRTMGIL